MAEHDAATKTMLDIARERGRQEDLRRSGRLQYTCATPNGLLDGEKLAVLTEEVGEVARAVLEKGNLVSDTRRSKLYEELIQVAAVAKAWAEAIIENGE